MKGFQIDRSTTRCHDWQTRLEACVRLHWSRPFQWGVNDCCTFACAALEAVTGRNPLLDWTDTYHCARAARRVLQAHGGVAAIAASRLGACIQPAFAQPGDVGIFNEPSFEDHGEALAVWCGAAWMCPGATGLKVVHPGYISRAWRCCRG